MAQTVSNLADVMKEVWTQDRLEKQFYDQNDWLQRIEKTNKFTHGKKAVVPIHKGRSGGYSVKDSAGGALNAADEQKVDRAEYTVPYNYQQIEVEVAALNEATGNGFSVGTALDLEVTGALSDIRNQVERQFVSNGDALIAVTASGAANTTVLLGTGGYGYDALVRGWLYPGLKVDIGTTADEDSLNTGGTEIVSVNIDATTPSFQTVDSINETTSTYVSIADARSATTSYESTGLRSIAGSTTSAVGGLDPDNAGEEFWKPAAVDTATTVLSLDLMISLQRSIMQAGGKAQTLVVGSLKQQANYYSLLQNQVRFGSDTKLGAGNVEGPSFAGLEFMGVNAIPDRELYFLTLDDFAIVTGAKLKKPTWVSDVSGNNQGLIWKQGYSSFVDALVYPVGLAIKRRNRQASAIGLTA